jgi:dihydroorotase
MLFRNARLVNRGKTVEGDLLVRDGRIHLIGPSLALPPGCPETDLRGNYLLPGVIDDQVHFREPGLTHKGRIYTESRAAVAGGTTSFMEMPNTNPQALTQELLEDKYAIAARDSPANYSFFMGASNNNLEEVLRTDPQRVCGVKIFMGSSTGNMLVDNPSVLEQLFSRCPMLIATHCEDEATIRANTALWQERYGEDIPMVEHPLIRSREACYLSSSMAVGLARKYGTRLHILHISTAEETHLFDNSLPLREKRITSEACVHHLHFTAADYDRLGSLIKCNPAIKDRADREAIWAAVLDDRIDIIATDHAPHTWEEKQGPYLQAPSGLPLVQHSLVMILQEVHAGRLSMERMVQKMSHAPAECFRLQERGYLDEGSWADLVVLDPDAEWSVTKDNLHYHCGWSPLEGETMRGKVLQTWVNGHLAYDQGQIVARQSGMRLDFEGWQ